MPFMCISFIHLNFQGRRNVGAEGSEILPTENNNDKLTVHQPQILSNPSANLSK